MDEESETTHYYLECDGGVEEWHWNSKSTKLLVELYSERRLRFRDPKTRKRALWTEIVDDMERAGYKGINEDICDRKWRNMKKTYRTCRETLKRNARKRVGWEYYDTFDDMFQNENVNVNSGSTITTAKPERTENDAPTEEHQHKELADMRYTSLEADTNMFRAEQQRNDMVPTATVSEEQQRQLLILERSRIAAIRELSKRIEDSNVIQRERNDLLREYLSQL